MQNINCCRSCDAQGRTRTIRILGRPVTVKSDICSENGVTYPQKPENVQLQLSVCPVSYCPANCPFCIATGTKEKKRLDIDRFADIMRRLKAEDRVRGVKITGGEPFCDVALLNEVICVLYEIFGRTLEVSVSTNGIRLDQLHRIRDLSYLESIHISRHHYDDRINRALFAGAEVPTGEQLRQIVSSVSFRDLFVFNCMLLKGYIDSPAQARRFLDFAIGTGVPKVGFMTCAPVNDFARRKAVPYEAVINDDDPSLLFTRGFFDHGICRCRDGVYVSARGDVIEFYGRSTGAGSCGYARGLVYDADDHLRDGFGGEVIV